MSEAVRIGKKYTIVIPKKIRKKLGLREGQISEIKVEEGSLIITPQAQDMFKKLEEIIGSVTYEEAAEKKAEKWLIRERKKRRYVAGR